MAAAGITGDAAKQMMAAVKGGGRKYFYFVSFGKKLCVLDIAFLLQAIIFLNSKNFYWFLDMSMFVAACFQRLSLDYLRLFALR